MDAVSNARFMIQMTSYVAIFFFSRKSWKFQNLEKIENSYRSSIEREERVLQSSTA